jgi:hypothetical protein
MTSQEQGIEQIRRLSQQAERRIRLERTLRVGARALCAALVVAVADVAARKVGLVPERAARGILGAAGLGIVAAAVTAWAWRLPVRAGARRLDRFHALHDRFANALAFADDGARTPFMDAAIEDAVAAAPAARPRLAVPIGVPRALGGALALSAALVVVMLFEVRAHVPTASAKTLDPLEMAPDDLEDVKDFLKQIQQKDPSDDAKAAIDEFNRLIDDIASRRLDRTEAFRRMQALEEKLLDGSAADRKALEQQLESMGEELKKAELTRPAGEAMSDARLDKARDAVNELAKKMRAAGQGAGSVDKAQLEQMREAVKKAAQDAEKRAAEIEQRRQELADEILKQKQKMGDGGSDEDRSLLEKKQRELERLDHESDEQKDAGRQLDRLDRELEQAAEDLMKDLGASADDLDKSAEDLNRMDEQQQSEQEKEQLRQKLQELRQLLRQQGQGGKAQVVRLKRFGQMARGQGGQGQQRQGQGSSGQGGQQGDGQGQGSQGQNGQGQGQQAGNGGPGGGQQGQQGQGGGQGGSQAGQGGETWVVGPNGERIVMLSRGSGGSGEGGGGSGEGQSGARWGAGHDPKVQGQATNPTMGTQDTQVQGSDSAQGGSRSQVILGASERGFTSKGYKKVYTEYHQVAEESSAKDDIPGGYRFYVKRYFQLIRPRDE